MHILIAAVLFLAGQPAVQRAVPVPFDMTRVQGGPVTVVRADTSVTVSWPDETKQVWRATFSLDPSQPLVTSIGPDKGEPVISGARPFYRGETGKRRGGWYAFFDDPASHPDGTRHVQSTFALRGAVARSIGERVELMFDGLRMGTFDGGLAFTFHPGSRLVQQEAVMTKAMGVDASVIMDFHGDGHPSDLTDVRLEELHAYFGALKAQSDPDFLLIPAEEANVHLGGHWALVFPKPVYWFMNRPKDSALAAFASKHSKYGTVYSVANAKEMLDLVRREGGYVYQTHPRTKGSTGFPDKIVDADYFRDASYLGVGWKAMPSDLSSPRLGDRALDLVDELNNQGLRKRMLGEVDVFQVDHTHELYAHMNINYVKLDRLPSFDRWGDALAPLARGEFFTTTGEILLPDVNLSSSSSSGDEIVAKARVSWTFPLRFAEIVWGDGVKTHREVIELAGADTREFGEKTFEWRANAKHWKWARVAVWDVAGNGAFVNPVWRD